MMLNQNGFRSYFRAILKVGAVGMADVRLQVLEHRANALLKPQAANFFKRCPLPASASCRPSIQLLSLSPFVVVAGILTHHIIADLSRITVKEGHCESSLLRENPALCYCHLATLRCLWIQQKEVGGNLLCELTPTAIHFQGWSHLDEA